MGSSSLVIAPTLEPLTLAEAKSHLRVEVPDDDALIASLMVAAREWIEGQTHRALMTQTWDFTFDEFPVSGLRLPLAPVQSITQVTYVDDTGATQTWSASPLPYRLVKPANHPVLEPTYGTTWPSARGQSEAVTVRAVCGYGDGHGTVPQPLRLALKILTGHWYEQREAAVVGSIVSQVPLSVESLISPYRRGFG